MRVPLIKPVGVVIARLDFEATRAVDPPGAPTQGYNRVLREPVVYTSPTTGKPTSAREEMLEIKVPCQVEVQSFERLRTNFGGETPDSNVVFVLHHRDLTRLGLLDSSGKCILKKMDRIVRVEKKLTTQVVMSWDSPLYVLECRPGSNGFGPSGHDLEILYTTHQASNPAKQR